MTKEMNTEKLLYKTFKRLLDGQDLASNEADFGEWADTVETLAQTPPSIRRQVFQSLDTFHRGELSRLLSTYRPEAAVPAMADDEEEEVRDWPDLPAHVQPDPALAVGAAPWLDEYMKFCTYWSPRSYEGYHEACGLWLLSTIAARRISFHLAYPYHTNLYMMLAGKSSRFTKSGATRLALDVLRQAGLNWLRTPKRMTPQAFVSYLVRKTPENYDTQEPERQEILRLKFGFAAQRGWFYEEFGNGIVAMTQSTGYMADFRSLLRELHDCPLEYDNMTQTRGEETVDRPYLTMIANLTPSDLRRVAKKGAQIWSDGFLARFGFIVPPPDDLSRTFHPDGLFSIPDDLVAPLQAWHRRLGLPQVDEVQQTQNGSFLPGPTQLRLTAPAPMTNYMVEGAVKDMMREYNLALLDMLEKVPEDLEPSYIRLSHKAIRIAVLFASLAGEEQLAVKHWVRAQMIVETWRASLHRIYRQIKEQGYGQSLEAELEDRVLDTVRRRNNPTAAEMRPYIRNYSTSQIEQTADDLVKTGLLTATGRMWGGRLVKRYRLAAEAKENSENSENSGNSGNS